MGAAPIHSKKKMKTLTALNQKLLKPDFLGRNALKPLGKSLRACLEVESSFLSFYLFIIYSTA
jgi:hypothetical protein